jgi:hypothetical protein
MFRTCSTVLTQDLTARVAATHTGDVLSTNLRLRWTARDGRLTARWEREPHDLTEGRTWRVSQVAA